MSLEIIERALAEFYCNQNVEVHKMLLEFQNTTDAWNLLWDMLEISKPREVQFFGATTLHIKITKQWLQLKRTDYVLLRDKIMDTLIKYYNSTGPSNITNKLCYSLCAYVIRTVPNHWPNAIPQLMETFQNSLSQSTINVSIMILEILMALPEEFSATTLSQIRRNEVRKELEKSSLQVLTIVDSILQSDSVDSIVVYALKCAASWLDVGFDLMKCHRLTDTFISVIFNSQRNQECVILAIDALKSLCTHPRTSVCEATVFEVLSKVIVLSEKLFNLGITEEPDIIVEKLFDLFLGIGDQHFRPIIQGLLNENTRDLCTKFLNLYLTCTNAPGYYPVNENYSEKTFTFWFLLQDDLLSNDAGPDNTLLTIVKPLYVSLTQVLIKKVSFPKNVESWTSDEKELFRCYRQDISDTFTYCYFILHAEMLDVLLSIYKQVTCDAETAINEWQTVEACLYAFTAIAEPLHNHEDYPHIEQLMTSLSSIPYNQIDKKAAIAAMDTIGAYYYWMETHPSYLNLVVPLLMMGLHNSYMFSSASIALRDIAKECKQSIAPYNDIIINTSMIVLKQVTKLKEELRLIYTIGVILSSIPFPACKQSLEMFLNPSLEIMKSILAIEDINECNKHRPELQKRIKVLGSLVSAIEQKSAVYHIIETTTPLLQVLAAKCFIVCPEDLLYIGVCEFFKSVVSRLQEDCSMALNIIIDILLCGFQKSPQSAGILLFKEVLIMFGRHEAFVHIIKSTYEKICTRVQCFFEQISSDQVVIGDILESYLSLQGHIFRKLPVIAFTSSNIDFTFIFRIACEALCVNEIFLVKTATFFLTIYIAMSREEKMFFKIIEDNGEFLVTKLMCIIRGDSVKTNLDPMCEVLLILNKKYSEHLRRWLHNIIFVQNIPLPNVTDKIKSNFLKNVLKEKSNKKTLQDAVKEFSFICRGLIEVDLHLEN
ncbi:importin-13 [Daktulosphaira vitifoliae]|uniref:importin-13 n=1 Tax=Daktulosphaira vitifoliae TaxID=58002 RepID=UPI0021A9F2C5|nr:importin-13 [Daktulosphaira vitifoliae]XP_050535320.1 importin-13 [Daktulosphaira vitifoliae]